MSAQKEAQLFLYCDNFLTLRKCLQFPQGISLIYLKICCGLWEMFIKADIKVMPGFNPQGFSK